MTYNEEMTYNELATELTNALDSLHAQDQEPDFNQYGKDKEQTSTEIAHNNKLTEQMRADIGAREPYPTTEELMAFAKDYMKKQEFKSWYTEWEKTL